MIVDHGKNTILALDQGRTALDPIAAVIIRHIAEFADGCAMDVATEHGVHVMPHRIMRHSSFEFADEADRVFHTPLGVSAERPIAETEAAPDEIDKRIEREQKLITKVASKREPPHVLYHGIEFVAVNNQDAFPGGGDMDCPLLDLDVAVGPAEVGHQLVVISRDVDHMRSFARFAQKFLDHVVVLLRPINSATQRPDIDQVADDVQNLEVVFAQKIQQRRGVAAACAQVRVGDPRSAITFRRHDFCGRFPERKSLLSSENSLCTLSRKTERLHSAQEQA